MQFFGEILTLLKCIRYQGNLKLWSLWYLLTKKNLHSWGYRLNLTILMITWQVLLVRFTTYQRLLHFLSLYITRLKTQFCKLSIARSDLLAAIFVMLKILRLLFAARIQLVYNRRLAPVKTKRTTEAREA